MANKGYAFSRHELIRTLTAYSGITTDDGNIGGTTLRDRNLIGRNDFVTEKTILLMTGDAQDEDKGAVSFAPLTGIITLQSAVSAQIKAGTIFRVLNISSIEIDVSTINTKIGKNVDAPGTTTLFAYLASLQAQVGELSGEAIVNGTQSKNWNAAEQDLVSLGAATTKYKLHSLIVDISQLTATATINIRLYMDVNGVERNLYDQPFVVGTDPDGCWIVNGTIGIHDILRVACQSDNAADDGKAIAYTYMLEAM